MGVRYVADIRPVEEVFVVSNLPMRLATFPDIVESSDPLPIPRATKCVSK